MKHKYPTWALNYKQAQVSIKNTHASLVKGKSHKRWLNFFEANLHLLGPMTKVALQVMIMSEVIILLRAKTRYITNSSLRIRKDDLEYNKPMELGILSESNERLNRITQQFIIRTVKMTPWAREEEANSWLLGKDNDNRKNEKLWLTGIVLTPRILPKDVLCNYPLKEFNERKYAWEAIVITFHRFLKVLKDPGSESIGADRIPYWLTLPGATSRSKGNLHNHFDWRMVFVPSRLSITLPRFSNKFNINT